MTFKFLAALSGILLLTVQAEQKLVPDKEGFHKYAVPFLKNYCSGCHGSKKKKGGIRFDNIDINMNNADTAKLWNDTFAQVQFSEMPPAKKKQPAAAEKEQFLAWLDTEMGRYGKGFDLEAKLLLPEYGNYVDHKKLFDGSVKKMPYTPARLWRQRPGIYKTLWLPFGRTPTLAVSIGGTGRDIVKNGPHKGRIITSRYFNSSRFANPFYEFVHHASGFTDYSSIAADQASLESLLTNAENMAEVLTIGVKVRIETRIKSKDSRHGNNESSFVGGVVKNRVERRGLIPTAFKKITDAHKSSVSRGDFERALDVGFNLFFQRLPNKEEYDFYWREVFQKNISLGNTMALQSVLIYICLSPEFVYRMEIGMGDKDSHGRRMLSPHELAHALNYAFSDKPGLGIGEFETVNGYTKKSDPHIQKQMTQSHVDRFNMQQKGRITYLDERLKKGTLKTRKHVEEVVRHFLGGRPGNMTPNHNSKISSVKNPRILQFFREFFGYHKANTVFKDVATFKNKEGFMQYTDFSPNQMMYDTDALILHILNEDKNILYELLTTNKVMTSYWRGSVDQKKVKKAGSKEKYVLQHPLASYNLDPFEMAYKYDGRKGLKAFEAPREQRAGILTQPSWLVAHSGNFENDPVRRGKWIREKLLAGYVMEVPITVNAVIPEDHDKTLRERFSVVQEDECWRCHKKMNPLGMPFEAFNHVGRFRAKELGKPVDTSGRIEYSGEESLEGEVKNVRELMEKLAKSEKVRQSFIRHVFRYWMGRNEMLSDSKTLIAMDKTYVKSGGSFKELLVTLITSDSFLYRK